MLHEQLSKFRNNVQETAQPSICAGYAIGGRICNISLHYLR
jgi:hypothetical protein